MSSNCGVVKKYVLALTAVLLVFATLGWAGDEKDDSKADSDIVKRMDKAADVLKETAFPTTLWAMQSALL